MPDLDADLHSAREELLSHIQVPDLARIHRRAAAVRRRRRLRTAAGGVALAVALVAGISVLGRPGTGPTPPAASATTPNPPMWSDRGLSLTGLGASAYELTGELHDVQFADPEHGYALAVDCPGANCRLGYATTVDGGRTWRGAPPPGPTRVPQVPPTAVPSLLTVDGGVLAVGQSAWLSKGQGWREVALPSQPPPADTVAPGGRLWLRTHNRYGCAPAPVEAWSPDGRLTRLARPPDLRVCRVVPAPAAGRVWWVGGWADTPAGRVPAVASSDDDGRTWTVTRMPAAGSDAWAQVTTLGRDVIVTVVSPAGGDPYPEKLRIHAVYRSAAGGPFTARPAVDGTLVGDLVWRLDGTLVVAGPRWYVSAAPGEPLLPAGGSMPFVRRIARTPGGWVAYDLFGTGFAAVSADGRDWHKINIY